jgi:hypothetical protein
MAGVCHASAGFIKQGIKRKIEQYLPGEKKP